MKARNILSVAGVCFVLTGCYHATVRTGAPMSNEKVEKKWASGWIYGIVPPAAVETASKCPAGVAQVDTQQSFTNGLVGMLTLGIYTPMEIVVTCAASGSAEVQTDGDPLTMNTSSTMDEQQESLTASAELSAETRAPVLIRVR